MLLGLCTVLVCITTVTSGILRGRQKSLPRYFFPEGPARRCLSPTRATNLCLPHYRKRPRLVPSDDALILRTARPTHPVAPARIWCADASGKAAISGFPTLPLMFLGERRTQDGRTQDSGGCLRPCPHTFPDALRKGSGLLHAVIVSFSCDTK